MKIVVRLILSFPLALVVPFNSLTWFQSDLKAVSCSCNNIRHLQNQEKDAVRSARRAGVIVEPVLGNLIPVRSQNGTRQRKFQSGAHFQVRSCSN